jgi:hypothetical protein
MRNKRMRIAFVLVALAGIGVLPVLAQEGSKPAPVLQILREAVKEGRGAAHEKVEADYAATFRRANYPGRYIALAAISGPSQVWFIEPMPSFAVTEEYDKAAQKEPLKSAIAMVESRDGELRAASRAIWAVYRPDLSYRPEKFNAAKTRYVMAGTLRVKLGHEEDFLAGAKTYFGGFQKANIDQCVLAYQVVAGAPAGTYLFFTMMDSMKALDGEPARMQAMQQAMGQENFSRLMKSAGDTFVSIEDTLFQVKPGMSYPPQDMVDADPGFWKPKPAAKPASAAAAPEKKTGQ